MLLLVTSNPGAGTTLLLDAGWLR